MSTLNQQILPTNATLNELGEIMDEVYNASITDPRTLNNRKGSEVYGEINNVQLAIIVRHLQLRPTDVFIDLGSGVDNGACYMAGCNIKKSIGIEILETPAKYAQIMKKNFEKTMNYYGKKTCEIDLRHGSFLDPKFKDVICKEATIIFMNNLLFGKIMVDLEKILEECRTGTRIISTASIVGTRLENCLKYRKGLRAVTEQVLLPNCVGNVSWKHKPQEFFLLTFIDELPLPRPTQKDEEDTTHDDETIDENKENKLVMEINKDKKRPLHEENHHQMDIDDWEMNNGDGLRMDREDDMDFDVPLPHGNVAVEENGEDGNNNDDEDEMEIPEPAGDHDMEANKKDGEEPVLFNDGVVASLRAGRKVKKSYVFVHTFPTDDEYNGGIAERVKR